ncbi:MAG: asparagine synthase (glutamine-hydrolyzing) [Christiangramia sp.]|uniref:asparagine synthase (glutamine-hydrolyzing) n=1 Tax=Christiangramia sp. TaxID=1931228 RepID=UPI003241DC2C
MCGIAGIIGKEQRQDDLNEMLRAQAHRGPDHTGTYIDKGFALLGHNRLSIIDLSSEANQPFTDENNRFHLTFNGEIYNYKELRSELRAKYNFKTASDTEVLLASYVTWGEECLDRLNGMFSFAIWDSKNKSLFAARDRFGVKPFYYTWKEKNLVFGSEIKTVRSQRKITNPNKEVWANYFCFGSYGMPWETFFKDIHQLPAGHYLKFSDQKLKIQKWYDFEEKVLEYNSGLTFNEAREYYLDLLKQSVSFRFRADVPVGFNISGGVDSSLLLSLVNLSEENKNIRAYTFYTGDKKYDEIPWVEKMIATTKNPLKKVKLTPEKVMDSLYDISIYQDEPFGGIPTIAYAGIFEQASKDGIKVLLDGQGMDEQWAGYDYYFQNKNNTIQGLGKTNPFKAEALNQDFKQYVRKPKYPEPFKETLKNLQYRDLFYTKIPRALRFNDRISMMYSSELREPFLDHRLVEFSVGLPEDFKKRGELQKFIIRDILREIAPYEIAHSPKRTLQTPQREWLGEELKYFVQEQLLNLEKSEFSYWFNHNEIGIEWKDYLNGKNKSSFHIWQWLNTSILLS